MSRTLDAIFICLICTLVVGGSIYAYQQATLPFKCTAMAVEKGKQVKNFVDSLRKTD